MGRAPSVRPSGHIRPEFLDQIEGLLIDDRLLRILKHDPEIFINIVAVGILEMLFGFEIDSMTEVFAPGQDPNYCRA